MTLISHLIRHISHLLSVNK